MLTSAVLYCSGDTSVNDMFWTLVDFAAWFSAAEGNEVGIIESMVAAVQYCHRVEVGMELPTKSPLLERVFSGTSRAHAVAGTNRACAARCHGTCCWKGKHWCRPGAGAAGSFGSFSPGVFFYDAVR